MTTREKMLKYGNLQDVLIVDFLCQFEKKLKILFEQFKKDTNQKDFDYMEFALYVFFHAQDLVLDPKDN